MAITSPIYDPTTTATKLATQDTAATKALLQDQSNAADATSSALNAMSSAMSAFQTTLASLVSSTKAVTANTATFSSTTVASATADAKAAAGTYSFYVEQLATAGQVSYGGITDSAATGSGNLSVTLADGSNFQIDLANADSNFDGLLSAKEIAAAINVAAGNSSRVTASTLSVNGQQTLVLSSNLTGAANAVSLDTSGVLNGSLKSQLDDPLNQKTLSTAQDAVLWIGAKTTGTKVQQASNVFNIVDDVKITITKAQGALEDPVTMTVASDVSGTAANVQTFVDAYNKLNSTLQALTVAGDPSNKTDAGPFATDAGVAALRSRMTAALRAVTGGQSLISFGIAAKRDGSLELDSGRLKKAIAANPTALDSLFGNATPGATSGVLGTLNTLVNQWTNSGTGQINARQATITKQLKSIDDRQDVLQTQYNNAYKRYLSQFTLLQSLQEKMSSTSDLFTALFSGKDG